MNDTYAGGVVASLPNSFDIDLLQPGIIFGWPILPHGTGTYYNITGRYINSVPVRGRGSTYGEYIPGNNASVSGEILAGAVNYQNNSASNYDIFLSNYGTSLFGRTRIGTALAASFGSLEISATTGNGIPILPSDYIGIYVEDPAAGPGNPPPTMLIEGTIYFSLK
jgi:hypothetical protein